MIKKIIEKVEVGEVFLFLVVMGYVILGIFNFALLTDVLTVLIRLIVRIAPILLIVFVVMFLANLFFENKSVSRFLGKGSGFQGWMVAIAGGIVSSGPIYMWYPLLSDLKKKGMKDSLIAAFLYNRAIKIPLLPMMIHYFGWNFTLTLSIYMVFFRGQWGRGSTPNPASSRGMKIAVAAIGKDETSEVSPRSGRSKFYLIFNEKGDLLEAISNPFSRGGGGAGFGVAKMLADKDVDIIVGRQVGEHMDEILKMRGLKYYEMTGTAKDVVSRILAQGGRVPNL
jgi:predicted Fe-Mo cluster-binding NifX family protein